MNLQDKQPFSLQANVLNSIMANHDDFLNLNLELLRINFISFASALQVERIARLLFSIRDSPPLLCTDKLIDIP